MRSFGSLSKEKTSFYECILKKRHFYASKPFLNKILTTHSKIILKFVLFGDIY